LSDENSNCIYVSGLRKRYGDNAYVVDDISFNVKYGKVFRFLGPNGAGKTTILKILTTLIAPTSGAVRIFGKDIQKHSMEIKNVLD
jgi:ABC-2 type transport system ATP-binding protein